MTQQRFDDEYAKGSFTFRRMTRSQVWTISIAAAAIAVALVTYSLW